MPRSLTVYIPPDDYEYILVALQALAAIGVAKMKNSKALAWDWAHTACGYAHFLGIESPLNFLGNGNYPVLDSLEELIEQTEETNQLTNLANPV